jgi:hypothetical protein
MLNGSGLNNKGESMKKSLLVVALLMLTGCVKNYPVQQGVPGKDGSSCTVTTLTPNASAPNGGSTISCTDGTSNLVLNGSNGAAGTVVQPVQFCAHPVTTYPNTFSELGFCIAGKIYAVYSQNSGFLVVLPDGNYSSNGINSSCSFTVTGCAISNQSN